MSDEILTALKKLVENNMIYRMSKADTATGIPEVSVATYLLLKILERLESIDETLAAMDLDNFNERHNK
jgi:hypothetical protein